MWGLADEAVVPWPTREGPEELRALGARAVSANSSTHLRLGAVLTPSTLMPEYLTAVLGATWPTYQPPLPLVGPPTGKVTSPPCEVLPHAGSVPPCFHRTNSTSVPWVRAHMLNG
jgi:hypothetical protein